MTPLSTAAADTQSTGSTLLVCVGRGQASNQSKPTDNKSNPYVLIGAHVYTLWLGSSTALYSCEVAAGGAGHTVTAPKPVPSDETTLSVVEIINGGLIQDVKWKEVLAGSPLTSAAVTTTGPALLVAWWWGDADSPGDKTAVPDNGFTVIDSILLAGGLVQCAVAVKQISTPGTYHVTWTATPTQGAQLWIAAVQASS